MRHLNAGGYALREAAPYVEAAVANKRAAGVTVVLHGRGDRGEILLCYFGRVTVADTLAVAARLIREGG